LIPEVESLTYGPYYGPDPGISTPTAFLRPEAYLAEVHDCHVLGGFGVVFQGDEALLDLAMGSNRYDLSSGLVPVVNRERVSIDVARVDDGTIPEGILLQSWFASNYHHWMVEHLPKLLLAEDVPPEVPLLVDGKGWEVPQLRDALCAVTDRKVIPLDWNVIYHVNRLHVPSNLFGTGPNLHRGLEVQVGDVTLYSEAIEWLRGRLTLTIPGHRRIYIDRRAVMAPVRLKNGDEVQQIFEDFGFETVHPADMTFAEQRGMFGDAAYVAGETGAAMTNVLLAPSSTVMICMQAQRWPLNIYADLCTYGGQRNLFIAGNPAPGETDGRTYQAAFTVDIDLLSETLVRILPA